MKCISSFPLSFCIGDGDGKQKEMEEGMLQQQDWQKFGHPHGAAELAGGFPLEKIPGERSKVLTRCLQSRSARSCFLLRRAKFVV